ncbi:CbtA family protein [Marinobacterium arenosum]|uniref:CbtA family protein n=1 Tax=Marinobacterium arenosum TaxID=2862496 RepID=UPI001C93C862|nr:CbtA family protein [Marinobacterium arenosum]MBY4676042.1 CbtA family protein [Marinobacterium arenosum]
MLFRRTITAALAVGILAGLLLASLQHFAVTPLIIEAEVFELPEAAPTKHHHGEAAGHSHSHGNDEAWGPADGVERSGYTYLTSSLLAIGFAMVLVSAMSARRHQQLKQGLLWGLAGFITFFGAPTLGLEPELPGMAAAELDGRQLWWLLTVALTGAGLACAAFAPGALKTIALPLLALPHLLGAPQPAEHGFPGQPDSAVTVLHGLHSQFITATTISHLLFWLALALLSALAVKFYIKPQQY